MSKLRYSFALLLALALTALAAGFWLAAARAVPEATVDGIVVTQGGAPMGGAVVRWRATENATTTAPDGRFSLHELPAGEEIEITAWADGYYIASTHVTPTVSGITLTLRPYHRQDHPEYAWVSPISGTSAGACGNCHPMIVSQWITNAHGLAVSNARFFSLYNGTDLTGTVLVGPGYMQDFPGTVGNCANCHAAGWGVDGYLTTDMNDARDVITAGIHCDYCHKIGGVYLNPATDSVYRNVAGVLSTRLLRPPPGDDIFFGPYDDIHDPDTYLPAMTESRFCAPCHQYSFWGTPIYASYDEWLSSPYPAMGIHCQNCHMPPTGDTYFALPEQGGLEHPPEKIPSHLQLGARSLELLQNTVTMTLQVAQVGESISVTVVITNTEAGHHVPTDHPGRHLILTVVAEDGLGQALPLQSGSLVPTWGGPQAGRPGQALAKVLRDVQTGEAPVVSYWKQALIVSDNRIPAMGSDRSVYTFPMPPGGGTVTVTAELRFRRTFYAVMEAKGWHEADMVMEQLSTTIGLAP